MEYEKFVFLVGKNNDKKYPIDFKKDFGIDYNSMKPKMLRIEEMKRICYWWKRGYSGSSFSLNVLNENTNIIMKEIWGFLKNTKIQGQPLFLSKFLKDFTSDLKTSYTIRGFKQIFEHKDVDLSWNNYDQFFDWWENLCLPNAKFTLSDFFKAYFIYLYYQEKSNKNPRIVPTILFEPHLNDQTIFTPLVLTFPYRLVLNCIREPIQTAGRIFQKEKSIFIYSDYTLALCMHNDLRKDYYVHRFEDLKLYPKESSIAICKILNIPFEEQMLHSMYSKNEFLKNVKTGEWEATGNQVTGFDLTPLHRKVDDVLSEFDQIRLKIFYDPILKHYGYPSFDFDTCPMTIDDKIYLMKFPFRFEKLYVQYKVDNISAVELRRNLFQNMVSLLKMWEEGKILLPKFIQIQNK